MSKIQTPVNQVRLTNVAVVRYKDKGKRFEIACYRNKVQNWRSGVEKDIDEVLQLHTIFINVSKGQLANKKDLQTVFGTTDDDEICRFILDHGDLQISDKERAAEQESKFRDIATIVAEKCINSETKRPYPVTMIESSMKEVHFSVNPKKNAKQQALEVIKVLQDDLKLPIQRAQMRVRMSIPTKIAKQVKKAIDPLLAETEEEEWGLDYELVVLIDPGSYRALEEMVSSETRGQGSLEILDLKVQDTGEQKL